MLWVIGMSRTQAEMVNTPGWISKYAGSIPHDGRLLLPNITNNKAQFAKVNKTTSINHIIALCYYFYSCNAVQTAAKL